MEKCVQFNSKSTTGMNSSGSVKICEYNHSTSVRCLHEIDDEVITVMDYEDGFDG